MYAPGAPTLGREGIGQRHGSSESFLEFCVLYVFCPGEVRKDVFV